MNKAFDINAILNKEIDALVPEKKEKKKNFTFVIFLNDKKRMEDLRIHLAKKESQILSQADLLGQGVELLSKVYPSVDFSPNNFKFKGGGRKKEGEEICTTSFSLSSNYINFLNNLLLYKLHNDIHYTKRYLFREIMDALEKKKKINK